MKLSVPACGLAVALAATLPTTAPAQDCPNYEYREDTPFGVSLEDVVGDFESCRFEIHKASRKVKTQLPEVSTSWPTDALQAGWSLPDFSLWQEPLALAYVRCDCWESLEDMQLFFRIDEEGKSRLMAVEKSFQDLLPDHTFLADFQMLLDTKAGYRGSAYLVYHPGTGEHRTLFRWLDETHDLLVDVNNGNSMAIRTLFVQGEELAAYLTPVWKRMKRPPPPPERDSAQVSVNEL